MSDAAMPELRVHALRDALTPDALRTLTSENLTAFLLERRWFGAKAGAPSNVRIANVIPLAFDGGDFAIARLEVTAAGGATTSYQLPLCVRDSEALEGPKPKAVLARVVAPDNEGLLFDAVEDGAFLRGLADSFATGATHASGNMRWIAAPLGAKKLVVPPNAPLRVGAAEQSNTSIIFDQEAILKLFRKLEPGEHPDVEVTSFLTLEASFPHTPVLLGVLRLESDAAGGSPIVAGMLQEFLPKSRDAWSFALDVARPYFTAPRNQEPQNAILTDVERLGKVTREMHEALATATQPAFAPERAAPEDVERWAQRTQHWIRDALSLLERTLGTKGKLPKERVPEAETLVRRRDHYLASVDEIVDTLASDAGLKLRAHGDYHLGQVLRTASDDFMVIDFEGEPARPLAERREKASPLRDVAGMLRSFAYAAATLATEAKALDVPTRELRSGRWERDTREAFLRGYLSPSTNEIIAHAAAGREGKQAPAILPQNAGHTRALLALFETEKVFYELAYELNNRPDWSWIPMRGISKLMSQAR